MLLFVDCETNSLSHADRIVQLAYIKASNNLEIIKAGNYFFAVKGMSEDAQAVHGFNVESLNQLADGKTFHDQVRDIHSELMNFGYNYCLVAHNAFFDFDLIAREFYRVYKTTNKEYGFSVPSIFCTMQKTTDLCGIPRSCGEYKWPSLNELQNFIGVSDDQVNAQSEKLWGLNKISCHDARHDVTCLFEIFKTAVAKKIFRFMNGEWWVYLTPERIKEEDLIRKHKKEMRRLEQEEEVRRAKYIPGPARNIITAEAVRKTGLPYYTSFSAVPEGLVSKTRAKQMKQKVQPGESPVAYALCRLHKGYIPLYRRYLGGA